MLDWIVSDIDEAKKNGPGNRRLRQHGNAVTNDGQGDGETCAAVQEMPMAGPARVRQILAALGFLAV